MRATSTGSKKGADATEHGTQRDLRLCHLHLAPLRLWPVWALILVFLPAACLAEEEALPLQAIVVSASRGFHNQRHYTNAQVVAQTLLDLGLPRNSLHLFLAAEADKESKLPIPGMIAVDEEGTPAPRIDPDLAGDQVTSEFLLNYIASGEYAQNGKANLLLFITGHGAPGALKFQDWDILSSRDLSRAVRVAKRLGYIEKLVLIIDSCHAEHFVRSLEKEPWFAGVSSSSADESSYSIFNDKTTRVSLLDRFTKSFAEAAKAGSVCPKGSSEPESILTIREFFSSPLFSKKRVPGEVSLAGKTDMPISQFVCGAAMGYKML